MSKRRYDFPMPSTKKAKVTGPSGEIEYLPVEILYNICESMDNPTLRAFVEKNPTAYRACLPIIQRRFYARVNKEPP